MQLGIASTETDVEQSGVLINTVFAMSQHILRKESELISIEKRDEELSGEIKELLVLRKQSQIVGTVVLQLAHEAAYVVYLTRDTSQRKGIGKTLMAYAEARAKNTHEKKKMRASTVYHPKYPQTKLISWYEAQGYKLLPLDKERTPTQSQQEASGM